MPGHLKVNCPFGAREATLGCPSRGGLFCMPKIQMVPVTVRVAMPGVVVYAPVASWV